MKALAITFILLVLTTLVHAELDENITKNMTEGDIGDRAIDALVRGFTEWDILNTLVILFALAIMVALLRRFFRRRE